MSVMGVREAYGGPLFRSVGRSTVVIEMLYRGVGLRCRDIPLSTRWENVQARAHSDGLSPASPAEPKGPAAVVMGVNQEI